MAAVLFGKGVKFDVPTVEAKANGETPARRRSLRDSGGGLAQSISGLFGN